MKRIFPKICFMNKEVLYRDLGAYKNKYGFVNPPPAEYLDFKKEIHIRQDLPILFLWECLIHEFVHYLIEIITYPLIKGTGTISKRKYQFVYDKYYTNCMILSQYLFKKYI